MRDIIFRGLTLSGEWVHGYLHVIKKTHGNINEGSFISNGFGAPFAYKVRPETASQYIGLKDLFGTKIYDKDILMDCDNRIMLVEWHNYGFCFKAITETNFKWACDIFQWFEDETTYPIIIGNEFENQR